MISEEIDVRDTDEEDVRAWNAEIWARQIQWYKLMAAAVPAMRDVITIENALTGETYPPMEEESDDE